MSSVKKAKKAKDANPGKDVSTKKVYSVSRECIHEYDIVVTENSKELRFDLYYSFEEQWMENIRGEKYMTLIDNGDGILIEPSPDMFTIRDYAEADVLRLLLNFRHALDKNEANDTKYEIVEHRDIIML